MNEIARVERELAQERVVAVVRHDRADDARAIAAACVAGGMRAIEVTLTTPDAHRIIAELVAQAPAGTMIGAGTVLRPEEVTLAVDAGARFLVAPLTDPAVLAAGRHAEVLTIPGAMTPTEIGTARAHGARTVKVFPAGCVGPGIVGAVRSVLPDVRLMPTGGVGESDLEAWLGAGAVAVGIGSSLNRAYDTGGAAELEALASRLTRYAVRPRHLAVPASDRSAR